MPYNYSSVYKYGSQQGYAISGTPAVVVPTLPVTTNLWAQYAANTLALSDGASISSFTDNSGNGRHATAATTERPTFKTGIQNGLAVARFDGTGNFLTLPDMSALTEGEAFIVVKLVADPPALDAQSGLWNLGAEVSGTHFPYTDGNIYESFGTTVRKTVGNPTPSLASTFRIYNVYSAANDFQAFLDGSSIFSTVTNTVGFQAIPQIGKHNNASYKLQGDMAEFIMYSAKQTAPNRASVLAYLQSKYGL